MTIPLKRPVDIVQEEQTPERKARTNLQSNMSVSWALVISPLWGRHFMDQHQSLSQLYPEETHRKYIWSLLLSLKHCYPDYCCGLNPSKNRSVAPWKKKKIFAQATGGAERKRVDVYHNTSSPSREQREGHDWPVYGHTCGEMMSFAVFLIKTHKVFTTRKYWKGSWEAQITDHSYR